MLKFLKEFFFPAKSKWIDVGMYEHSGYYKLVQMRYRLNNNKKEFRKASMGFINDPYNKEKLFSNTLKHNAEI